MKQQKEQKEQCEHEWEDEERYQKFIARSGNSIMGGYDHFTIVIIQRCRKCNKLNQSSV